MLITFAVKAQGTSHIEKGTPCQDAAFAKISDNKSFGIACVADGHGGSKYFRSEKGSLLAVQIAEKALTNFYITISKELSALLNHKVYNECTANNYFQSKLKELEGNIIYSWRNAVFQDIENNPFSDLEIEYCKLFRFKCECFLIFLQ